MTIVKYSGSYASFDQMTWPTAKERAGEVQWRLRYAPDQITPGDRMVAASIIAAYQALVEECSQKKRNFVCKVLKNSPYQTTGEK